jgi:hypothetical protein
VGAVSRRNGSLAADGREGRPSQNRAHALAVNARLSTSDRLPLVAVMVILVFPPTEPPLVVTVLRAEEDRGKLNDLVSTADERGDAKE